MVGDCLAQWCYVCQTSKPTLEFQPRTCTSRICYDTVPSQLAPHMYCRVKSLVVDHQKNLIRVTDIVSCKSSVYFWCMYRGFSSEDACATIQLNTSVCGDVTIVAYHARSTFGGKVQGKVIWSQCWNIFYRRWRLGKTTVLCKHTFVAICHRYPFWSQ